MMSPIALAVLRLMVSSNFVGVLHRKIARLLASQDAIDIAGRTAELPRMSDWYAISPPSLANWVVKQIAGTLLRTVAEMTVR